MVIKLVINGGVDFVKISIGKVVVNVMLVVIVIMLNIIKVIGKKVGFKVVGGVRIVIDVVEYLVLVELIMGEVYL